MGEAEKEQKDIRTYPASVEGGKQRAKMFWGAKRRGWATLAITALRSRCAGVTKQNKIHVPAQERLGPMGPRDEGGHHGGLQNFKEKEIKTRDKNKTTRSKGNRNLRCPLIEGETGKKGLKHVLDASRHLWSIIGGKNGKKNKSE